MQISNSFRTHFDRRIIFVHKSNPWLDVNLCELLPGDEPVPVHVEELEGDVGHRLLALLLRHPPHHLGLLLQLQAVENRQPAKSALV